MLRYVLPLCVISLTQTVILYYLLFSIWRYVVKCFPPDSIASWPSLTLKVNLNPKTFLTLEFWKPCE